jgi:hypothetical protein
VQDEKKNEREKKNVVPKVVPLGLKRTGARYKKKWAGRKKVAKKLM